MLIDAWREVVGGEIVCTQCRGQDRPPSALTRDCNILAIVAFDTHVRNLGSSLLNPTVIEASGTRLEASAVGIHGVQN